MLLDTVIILPSQRPARPIFRLLRVASQRAPRLAKRMNRIRTRAADHARAWSCGYGDSDSSKIASGTDWSACSGFQLTPLGTSEEQKRSGAVSPAMRATASVAP